MCPKCKEPMIVMELEGIEIDHCLSCRGTWLDGGEIEAITEQAGVGSGSLTEAVASARAGKKSDRRCPRCRRRLRVLQLPTVELDTCPLGHGLWFDQGEMLTFISSHAGGEEDAVGRFFTDIFRSELESQTKGD